VVTASCRATGDLARIPPLPVGHPVDLAHCNHRPTTTTKSNPTRRWPSTTCASLKGQAPTSGRRRAVVDTAGGNHADPGHPSLRAAGPPPRPSRPHSGLWSDTTDAGSRTLDTWTHQTPTPDTDHLDRPHRTPDARTGHRALARTPDTGRGDDSTAGVRTSLASTPSDRTLRRPIVFALSHYQPAPRPLRRPNAAPAHCCPSDDYGSSVERRAKRQVLCPRLTRVDVAGREWRIAMANH
jgi:hypothetical protein